MSVQNILGGQPRKNDGGFILGSTTPADNLVAVGSVTGPAIINTYPASGANAGTLGPIGVGQFAKNTDDPLYFLTGNLAGVANTGMQMGRMRANGDVGFNQYERYNITNISASGIATKGVNAGAAVLASGITGGAAGKISDNEISGNGEFVYYLGSGVPAYGDY